MKKIVINKAGNLNCDVSYTDNFQACSKNIYYKKNKTPYFIISEFYIMTKQTSGLKNTASGIDIHHDIRGVI